MAHLPQERLDMSLANVWPLFPLHPRLKAWSSADWRLKELGLYDFKAKAAVLSPKDHSV